jgi:hypothetical protein
VRLRALAFVNVATVRAVFVSARLALQDVNLLAGKVAREVSGPEHLLRVLVGLLTDRDSTDIMSKPPN